MNRHRALARLALSALLGVHWAVACVVPTFDVDSASSTKGGASTAGSAGRAGGQNVASGGKAGVATQGGADPGVPDPALGGEGNNPPGTGGDPSSSSEAGAGGAGAGGAGAGVFPGPKRIGFSMFHDSASGEDYAAAELADATFDKPAGTKTGDFMLVFFGADHSLRNLGDTELMKAHWTLVDQSEEYGTDGQAIYLMYHWVTEDEPSQIIFRDINDVSTNFGVQGLLSVYRGVNPTSPINDYQPSKEDEGSSVFNHVETPTPAITTTVDDCLLIAGLSPDSAIDAPKITSWPAGFDLNRVSVQNPPAPHPNGWANIYAAEHEATTAGTMPGSAFGWQITNGANTYYGSYSFVLALAP